MAKYKLIKTYPGSPELGHITSNEGGMMFYYKDHPTYWEEVVEKGYEVLSYHASSINGNHVDPDYIWYETSKGNGRWSRKGHITAPYTTDEINNHKGYSIHSVKRLSDGEIFTIGDVINTRVYKDYNEKIIKIEIDPFKNSTFKGLYFKTSQGNVILNSAIKSKISMFTTKDGVDIFDGDSYWCVNHTNNSWPLSKQTAKENTRLNKFITTFHSEEKAKAFIIWSKPILNLTEIMSVIRDCENDLHRINKLSDKIKTKDYF